MRYRLLRVLTAVCRHVFQAVLKALVTFLICTVCLIVTLRYLGIPLPSVDELLPAVDGLSELARILS